MKRDWFCFSCLSKITFKKFLWGGLKRSEWAELELQSVTDCILFAGKAYEVTYVRLTFKSSRPESYAIYKQTHQDGPWIPYQYYSTVCRDQYGIEGDVPIRRGDEARAYCSSEYSDISPLTGGSVAFGTLEGRPSNLQFEQHQQLQEWVTATAVRITLDRMNTFRDELFGKPEVLKSYYYAISDLAVGGRCKCNGHASECILRQNHYGEMQPICNCSHFTDGVDCEKCLPFYNDAPWGRATKDGVHECKRCNCNGRAAQCYFDQELYERTGHGGHCVNCTGNTAGPNCERCKDNFFMRSDGTCIPCDCDEIGSRSLQCSSEGRCQCRPGVGGDKCDRCLPNHYGFGRLGCTPCGCNPAGSLDNTPRCDPGSGECMCKSNVEGRRCDKCKPGYFNLDMGNTFGCTPCFCYAHASVCHSAPGYAKTTIESIFSRGNERWTAEDVFGQPVEFQYNAVSQNIGVQAPSRDAVYFVAPERFLGDQRSAYNQLLSFSLRIGEVGPRAKKDDIIIEGAGLQLSQTIFGQGNPLPNVQNQRYDFRLHEHRDHGWSPNLSARDFISVLSNITAIKLRGTYTAEGVGYLDDVQLEVAQRGAIGSPANWVETCTCPEGFVGQFCESCAPGYRHDPPNGGPFARCVPCNCHGHASICDSETGQCICQDNTAGAACELCARGYYGNALQGTDNDCQQCPCPDGGACLQLSDNTVACLECPKGYAGHRCELCTDGFYGDPTGQHGAKRPCQPCDCNGNVDPNAVGNCNRTTGECLKCIYSTGGARCDQCLAGYFGDPLAFPKGDCKACGCNPYGTVQQEKGVTLCDQLTGQCQCKRYVIGQKCDRCADGYYNLRSGGVCNIFGCQPCNCDPIGSVNITCNTETGQCSCKPGVVGLRCDQCTAYSYGFSFEGCKPCECDQIGSVNLQCEKNGQCPCRDNVEGRQCNRCKENKYDRQAGCLDCPPCYNLVQEAVNVHRGRLTEIEGLLDEIATNPTVAEDINFEMKLQEIQRKVNQLLHDTRSSAVAAAGSEKSLAEQLEELYNRIDELRSRIADIADRVTEAGEKSQDGERTITRAETVIREAKSELKSVQRFLESEGQDALQRAKERSEQFGQQSERMSDISREARQLADKHEEEARQIETMARDAFNTSLTAYNLAVEAIEQQRLTSQNLSALDRDADRTLQLLAETKDLSARSQEQATKAEQEALSIISQARLLSQSSVDVSGLKKDAEKLKDEAQRINDEARDLMTDNSALMGQIQNQMKDAEQLKQRAISQQQEADGLLADVDAAHATADEAVKKGNAILEDAKKTLETLQGFDMEVQSSKDEAMQALSEVDEIEDLIREAQDLTKDSQQALKGAQSNAQDAWKVAKEAEETARRASQEAGEILRDARDTKHKADATRGQAEDTQREASQTKSTLSKYEEQVKEDAELSLEALKRANAAKNNAQEASKSVAKALAEVQKILSDLNRLESPKKDEIEELERKLNETETRLQQAGLESILTDLKEALALQV
ncbi:unnamed protein product [Darwinula stevensoni]|uniref:Laminin subunit gamma-1 n=1 Tax=Darwinula stevensoni TaxID=69355 RepID=A0A7R8XBK2_9CRUS|nr:unnamed protein product [Darwinula stevensoni]CAG0891651.1 unnamed protein product [Darwinula stevensoni]